MITVRLPALTGDRVRFELSPLSEAAHSWHVLSSPGHHALQLPWVRRCRFLPTDLRAALRRWSWVVRDYVPALFEAGASRHTRSFAEELRLVAELPRDQVVWELGEAARVNAVGEPDQHVWLARIEAEPHAVLAEILDLLDRYWKSAFAEQWTALESQLLDTAARGGAVLPMLRELTPAIRIDRDQRMLLDRPHDHDVVLTEDSTLLLTPSFYAWPHVRVTCDQPWPLRLTFPVDPVGPHPGQAAEPAQLLPMLRALAAQPRLAMLDMIKDQPRSTQELSALLGLSAGAVSKHLQQLLQVGLVNTRREGYYQLYELSRPRLSTVVDQLLDFMQT